MPSARGPVQRCDQIYEKLRRLGNATTSAHTRWDGWDDIADDTDSRVIGNIAEDLFLDVGFQEPQRLITRPGIGGEEVAGIGVAGLVRLVDGRTDQIGGLAIALDQSMQMVLDLVDVCGVG